MPQYDGSIRINTEIDAKNVTSQMQRVVNQIQKAEAEVSRLRARMDELKNAKIPTSEYVKLQKELDVAINKYEELKNQVETFERIGTDKNFMPFRMARDEAQELYMKIEDIRGAMFELEEGGKAFTIGSDSEEYARSAQKIQELNRSIDANKLKLSELKGKQAPVTSEFSRMKDAARQAFSAISRGITAAGKVFSKLRVAAHKAFSAISSGSQKSSGLLSTFASRLKGLALSLLVFNWISKAFNSMISGMKTGVGNFMNYSSEFSNSIQRLKNALSTLGNQFVAAFAPIIEIVIPWLIDLINVISTAMTYVAQFIAILSGKSTFTRAKQVQDGYNKSLGGTASAAKKAYGALAKFDDLDVLQKKDENNGTGGAGAGEIGGGFEEVPVSDKFKGIIDWFKEMWENADFYDLGKLLGEKLKEALENIPWDEIKEAARKLGKSLASFINGFIEVEELGYTIGKTLAQAFNTAFEFLNSFVHELHWASVGKFIAETLNGAFENIDWELIRDTFVTGAKGLADAINSFNTWFHWDNISNTISKGINTITETILTFFDNVDWSSLGENIGKQFTETIKKIDWKQAGSAFSTAAESILDLLLSGIEEIDWGEVGTSIRDFLMEVDWQKLLQDVGDLISETLNGLIHVAFSALGGDDDEFTQWQEDNREKRDQASKEYDEWYENMSTSFQKWQQSNREKRDEEKEAVGTWIDGLKEKFTSWQADNREKRDAEKEAYGAWIEEIAIKLSEGWESIKETASIIWESIKEFFVETWTSISETASEAWTIFSEFLSELWTSISEIAIMIWDSVRQFLSDTWENIKTTAVNVWNTLKLFFATLWTFLKTTAITIFTAIKTFLQTTWENIKATATTLWTAIKTFFKATWENVKEIAIELWTSLKNWFFNTWNNIKEKATEVWENIKMTFEEKMNAIKDKVSEIIEKFNEFKENASEVFNNIKEAISEAIGDAIGKLGDFIGKIRDAIQAVKDFLASGWEKVSGFFGGGGGSSGGGRSAAPAAYSVSTYSMPEIPALASGSVIRGGNPFLALLGDQPSGQTNIEAPLETIERALENVMSRNGNERVPVNINLQYDGQTFARLSLDDILSEANRRGYDVSILGVT